MSGDSDAYPAEPNLGEEPAIPYVKPRFPNVPFYLLALDGGWSAGPFNDNFYPDEQGNGRPGWLLAPNGGLNWCDSGGGRPILFRVRGQEDDLIHANDGDAGPMTYRVVVATEIDGDDGDYSWLDG